MHFPLIQNSTLYMQFKCKIIYPYTVKYTVGINNIYFLTHISLINKYIISTTNSHNYKMYTFTCPSHCSIFSQSHFSYHHLIQSHIWHVSHNHIHNFKWPYSETICSAQSHFFNSIMDSYPLDSAFPFHNQWRLPTRLSLHSIHFLIRHHFLTCFTLLWNAYIIYNTTQYNFITISHHINIPSTTTTSFSHSH